MATVNLVDNDLSPTGDEDADSDGDGKYLCGYEMVADINLGGSATPWEPIGDCGSNGACLEDDSIGDNDDNPFTAIFDGSDNTISNLYIRGDTTDTDRLGFFALLEGATVRSLNIMEVDVQAIFENGDTTQSNDNNILGVLAGSMQGNSDIRNVVVTDGDSEIDLQGANTEDPQGIGGLIGESSQSTII